MNKGIGNDTEEKKKTKKIQTKMNQTKPPYNIHPHFTSKSSEDLCPGNYMLYTETARF